MTDEFSPEAIIADELRAQRNEAIRTLLEAGGIERGPALERYVDAYNEADDRYNFAQTWLEVFSLDPDDDDHDFAHRQAIAIEFALRVKVRRR